MYPPIIRSTAVQASKAAVLAIALAVGFGAAPVAAYPAYSIEIEYFSDATFNDPVGGRGITCGGNQWRWGEQTEFARSYSESCDRPEPVQF
ncbi:MAG: DUF6289 family protein [Brevundimonas sp.]|uniref:DUF6289 family protein n=1 Tax=Brevundimonas sp. TaxID=1871086 RepID=UPI00248A2F8D|nr:DUF6289 family protein [Brevundimonas sp.]MDI1328529.1 DUF6289 family protein [Brevundimonas sp.]